MTNKIVNISLDKNFLHCVALKLLNAHKKDDQYLLKALIITPNKRVIKNLHQILLQISEGAPIILPKMISINEFQLLSYPKDPSMIDHLLKQELSNAARLFMLAQLIQKATPKTPYSQVFSMAIHLAQLIDRAYLENADLTKIGTILPHNFSAYWNFILKFLSIITNDWPNILNEMDKRDKVQNHLLHCDLQNQIWQENPVNTPVIGINILSYNTQILNLMRTIKHLPQGQLFFYGIPNYIFSSTHVEPTNPQHIVQHTIKNLKINSSEINIPKDPQDHSIYKILDQYPPDIPKKTIQYLRDRINIIKSDNEEQEARTIALILRETLEKPNHSAALITNNKSLINRVTNELKRWNINIDDNLGIDLVDSLQAKFFLLSIKLLVSNYDPHTLLALLKHPFCHLGETRDYVTKYTNKLDISILRKLLPDTKLTTLLKHCGKDVELASFLKKIFSIYTKNHSSFNVFKKYQLQELLQFHIKISESLAKEKHDNNLKLWSDQAGKKLIELLESLLLESEHCKPLTIKEYAQLMQHILKSVQIVQAYDKNPRLHIYSNLQSNLISHDTMIVGSLNEGNFPNPPSYNPFIHNQMLATLGFLPKETTIGLQANIFLQILNSPQVFLTRSLTQNNDPTVPSRWLLKIENIFQKYQLCNKDTTYYSYLSNYLTTTIPTQLITNNISMQIPLRDRPKSLYATSLEYLAKNPYIFFVKYVLKLKILDPIYQPIDQKIYGRKIHRILEQYMKHISSHKNLNIKEQETIIMQIAKHVFKDMFNIPYFRAFQWRLLKYNLVKFIKHDFNNMNNIQKIFLECTGTSTFNINGTNIKISGRADRIDLLHDNTYRMIDYKTSATQNISNYQTQISTLSLLIQYEGFKSCTNKKHNSPASYVMFLPNKNSKNIEVKELIEQENIEELLKSYYHTLKPYDFTDVKTVFQNEYLVFANYYNPTVAKNDI